MNPQRLIFLDFDGVIALTGSVDRSLTQRVQALVTATKADVVLSTSWRTFHSQKELQQILHTRGLHRVHIIGQTPILKKQTRGAEIASWLQTSGAPTRFAVLDDNDTERFDMAPVRAHLVKTEWTVGVTAEDVRRAQRLLTTGPVWTPERIELAS